MKPAWLVVAHLLEKVPLKVNLSFLKLSSFLKTSSSLNFLSQTMNKHSRQCQHQHTRSKAKRVLEIKQDISYNNRPSRFLKWFSKAHEIMQELISLITLPIVVTVMTNMSKTLSVSSIHRDSKARVNISRHQSRQHLPWGETMELGN